MNNSKIGMKLICVKPILGFEKGEITKIVKEDIVAKTVSVSKEKDDIKYEIEMTFDILITHFEFYDEEDDDFDEVEELLSDSDIKATTCFDVTTVVQVTLPNGFVLSESYSCFDKEEYNFELGVDICLEKIKVQLHNLTYYKEYCDYCEQKEECDECEDRDVCEDRVQ